MFQPGEEGWHGARYMLQDGLLDDPRAEAAFALHISPNITRGVFSGRGGPAMASADVLSATIEVAAATRPCRTRAWTRSRSPARSSPLCKA